MTELVVHLEVTQRRLEARLGHAGLERYVAEPFFAEYDDTVDLRAMPEELVTIPLILNVAPVVWATGGRYEVERMDARLAASLARLHTALRALYPELSWEGEIVPRATVPTPGAGEGGTAALFSGGVDSVYTALVDPAPRKLLVTACGSDIAVDNAIGWEAVRAQASAFARKHGHRVATVRSNFFTFLNKPQINHLTPSIPDWWAYVQHGMGLSGLTAPALAAAGASRLLIAATHTEDYATPWGSSPRIDDLIAWGGVRVVHHGFDASRQEKIQALVEVARGSAVDAPFLRVCYVRPDGVGGNCGACEKCLRTATGLIVEGEDPRSYGFPFGPDEVGARARDGFTRSRVATGEDEGFMWRDIQSRARSLLADRERGGAPLAGEAYLLWLAGFDFDAYLAGYLRRGRVRRRLAGVLARYPRVQAAARRGARRG